MTTQLSDQTTIHHQDNISIPNRAKSVSDKKTLITLSSITGRIARIRYVPTANSGELAAVSNCRYKTLHLYRKKSHFFSLIK
jgi:hypothetical protein